MKFKLVFGRTEYDQYTAWSELKEITVDVPDYLFPQDALGNYHLIGGYPSEDEKTDI